MPVTDVRLSGVLHTVTWNTFCCSKRLPTSSPASIVAAARRTSPGFKPYRLALSRSTSTSMLGWSSCLSIRAAVTPSTPETIFWTLAAVASSVANDGPKTRTVMSLGEPVSKWRTRSSRYVLTLWAMPG